MFRNNLITRKRKLITIPSFQQLAGIKSYQSVVSLIFLNEPAYVSSLILNPQLLYHPKSESNCFGNV